MCDMRGIGVTVSQMIPSVLSDSRHPQGPPLLLRIQQSIRHLSYGLKHKSVCVCEGGACVEHECFSGHTAGMTACTCMRLCVVFSVCFYSAHFIVLVQTFSR